MSVNSCSSIKKQQGLALLVLVVVIALAFITYTVSGLSITKVKVEQVKKTQIVLKKAKQALINYAVTYSDRGIDHDYGIFPYPETDFFGSDDGNTETVVLGSTKNTNVIGWLPWRALDIPNYKDESGTCLFYAVSGTYKLGASVQADMINEDSIGMFQVKNSGGAVVEGGTVDKQIVALVIAPGEPLSGQTRTPSVIESSCGRDYANVSAYLDNNGSIDNSFVSSAADTVDDFIHATETSKAQYNDRFLTITRDEIWKNIVKRSDFKEDMKTLTQALAMCLANYANMSTNTSRRLPWPVNTDFAVAETDYRQNSKYKDEALVTMKGYSGRYPFNVANSNTAINGTIVGSDLFDLANCSNLGVDVDGITINLTSAPPAITKYRKLWNNWKDHFFYIISKVYEPGSGVIKKCADATTSCVKVNAIEYAGAVIFSGSRLSGVTRNDKSIVSDYLEDGKNLIFDAESMNKTGDGAYTYTDPSISPDAINDIMYCIEDNPIIIDDPLTPAPAIESNLNVIPCVYM